MRSLIALLGVAGLAFGTVPAANAATLLYKASLSGSAEAPPNASPGTGSSRVTINTVAHSMRVQADFAGLLGTTTAAHIHAPTAVPGTGTAGVATQVPSFVGFPLGVTSGSMDNTLDLLLAATYNPAFVTGNGGTTAGAEAALLAALNEGRAYFNIHSASFPGGEIRGFYALVPEPATWATMIAGFGLVGGAMRRAHRQASIA